MRRPQCGVVTVSTLVFVATLACAGGRPAASAMRAGSARDARVTNSKVLGLDELRLAPGSNAFQIVQERRPLFLRSRGHHAPTVFVDYAQRGGTDTLREIDASDIAEIRYLDSTEATLRNQLKGKTLLGRSDSPKEVNACACSDARYLRLTPELS